jgi:hypothetical protein
MTKNLAYTTNKMFFIFLYSPICALGRAFGRTAGGIAGKFPEIVLLFPDR